MQSEDIELEDAEVTITSGGAPLAVDVEPLRGYGPTNAITSSLPRRASSGPRSSMATPTSLRADAWS
ncbi:hypothetical protein [Sorangium sp. So ce1099]|uniref:hypothetical protein n=1 Tax=Sorangium sp. So ce1099 TaxID=3133331 RepID=UPI003F609A02